MCGFPGDVAREVVGMEISRVVIVVRGFSSVEGWKRTGRKGVCLLVGKSTGPVIPGEVG